MGTVAATPFDVGIAAMDIDEAMDELYAAKEAIEFVSEEMTRLLEEIERYEEAYATITNAFEDDDLRLVFLFINFAGREGVCFCQMIVVGLSVLPSGLH